MYVLSTKNCSLAMLPVLTAAMLFQACGGGGDAVAQILDDADPVVGVWESAVAIRDCASGATLRTFKGLTVLHRGGTASGTNSMPPAGQSPAFGTWKAQTTPSSYTATFRFYRFNADGTLAGAQSVARTITLGADRNSITGTISVQVLDAANNPLGPPGCGIETTTRIG